MLKRTHVAPFLRESDGVLTVEALTDDPDGRVIRFLDRLCRLARRLEGAPRSAVVEALRRQERRVRDQRRLDGIARTLLDACRFTPHPLAEQAAAVRDAVFTARGALWPPVPGDGDSPYRQAGAALGLTIAEAREALYADRRERHRLARAPAWHGRTLLDRYNLELARAVLLDAARVTVSAQGGWSDLFRSVKLARLMYRIEREGPRRYRVELTGPAAPFISRTRRYGIRFARVFPAVARAPGWRIDAEIVRGDTTARFELRPGGAIRSPRNRRRRFDSRWEADLAAEFAARLGDERDGWTLSREDTPVAAGVHVFLPDFTFRHLDGREALVEIIGFWTPEYLRTKTEKIRNAGLDNMVLVVYRGLAAGGTERVVETLPGHVLWFTRKPRIQPIMEVVERVAHARPSPTGRMTLDP